MFRCHCTIILNLHRRRHNIIHLLAGGIRPKINPNCHTHTHTGLKTGLNILLHLLITMHTETLLSPVRILLNYKLKNKCELRQSRSC